MIGFVSGENGFDDPHDRGHSRPDHYPDLSEHRQAVVAWFISLVVQTGITSN